MLPKQRKSKVRPAPDAAGMGLSAGVEAARSCASAAGGTDAVPISRYLCRIAIGCDLARARPYRSTSCRIA
ncbi:exported hypothetical protein [Burkholderiales bacterium]|nr:exported hypothetical protein [Burkholderiales bacterium]